MTSDASTIEAARLRTGNEADGCSDKYALVTGGIGLQIFLG
jgi:hypothetical protein